jgi:hypothetical protein
MITVKDLAQAALERDNFHLKCLVQELWQEKRLLTECPKPETNNPQILSLAAGLVELLATQWKQIPPPWTKEIGGVSEPFFLAKHADDMKNLPSLCETESPEPLRKRNLYAPPNFLEFV